MDKEDATNTTFKSSKAMHTDDESITTSTESDTFDSWTLVTDKQKRKEANLKNNDTTSPDILDRVEELQGQHKIDDDENDSENKETHNGSKNLDQYSTIDEFSDGISIISDSESGGRISPHPYLRVHLNDLSLKYSTGENDNIFSKTNENPPISSTLSHFDYDNNEFEDNNRKDKENVRQRHRKRSSTTVAEKEKALQPAENELRINALAHIPPIVKHGLTGLFYIGVALAFLAFIGKLRYPEWDPTGAAETISVLEVKVERMELQNNLMRAEIDILSRQVDYLTSLKSQMGDGKQQQQQQQQKHYHDKKDKRFKVWQGIGDSLDPVEITKAEAKQPYKCPDGKFVEITGMCVEKQEPLVEQVGNIVDEALQQSETFKSFEKVVETLNVFKTDEAYDPTDTLKSSQPSKQTAEPHSSTSIPEATTQPHTKDYREEHREHHKHDRREERYQKDFNRQSAEKFDRSTKPNSKERYGNGKRNFQQQQQQHQQMYKKQYDSGEDDDDDSKERSFKRQANSKERFNNNSNKFDKSRERNDNSKERSTKQRRKSNSGERQFFKGDGDWHEQYMNHREHARRQNSREKHDKNWFIERGDSREQARVR